MNLEEASAPVEAGPSIEVLLVEDSPGDVMLTREAFHATNKNVALQTASDGEEALEFLRSDGTIRPVLILLDLNLPKLDGREVLAQIKADPKLKLIPTVILTTSPVPEDIESCYKHQANCYLTKPINFADFERLVSCINNAWLTDVKLPQPRNQSFEG